MNSVTLSLPECLNTFVDQQARERGHASDGESVRELIGKEQERQRLREVLLAGAASEPGATVDAGYFASLRARIRDVRR